MMITLLVLAAICGLFYWRRKRRRYFTPPEPTPANLPETRQVIRNLERAIENDARSSYDGRPIIAGDRYVSRSERRRIAKAKLKLERLGK